MFGDRDPSHYLRPLKSNTLPQRYLWLHCDSNAGAEQGVTVERWERGTLGKTHWTSRNHTRVDTLDDYPSPDTLWRDVDEFCTPGRRVVLWAFDLAYQLRISQALVQLPALGWKLDKIVLERTASWALLRDGTRTLMCCDLKSWIPGDIERMIGAVSATTLYNLAVAQARATNPHVDLSKVIAIRETALHITGWLDREQLGPFRPTGSGQSYSAFRRRFLQHQLLVHDDMERLHMERVAMWTGRCEAWRHGVLDGGPFVEYDMTAAYCRIAAECDVPMVARHVHENPTRERVSQLCRHAAVLAECEIDTDIPVVPTSLGGRTIWPVGRFKTVLWDPELQLALTYAKRVRVTRAWSYDRGPALQTFAQWVLDTLDSPAPTVPPITRMVMKHWSRCLVGRLGLRYRAWEPFGTQDEPDLRLVTFIDTDERTSTDMLIAGHDRMILADMAEAAESLPQIPGWVMSECRARLWQAMVNVDLRNVIYIDTDSIIVDGSHDEWDHPSGDENTYAKWAVKGRYSRMTIYGPRNLVCETDRRVAGLPLTARQVAPLEFTGQIMRSIKESMRAGELDCVASLPRRFVLDAPDLRRQHLPYGATAPFHVQPSQQSEDDDAHRY